MAWSSPKGFGSGGKIKISNGILKENLHALEDISKNDFVTYFNSGYTNNTVGQINGSNLEFSEITGKIIKLKENYFMLIGYAYCQPFFYDGETFKKGAETYISAGQVSWATADPYALGCVFCGGTDGSYTTYYIGYISVNEEDLSCTVYKNGSITGSSRAYGGYIDFVTDTIIIYTSGDYAMGTCKLNRSNFTFTAISALQDDGNGLGIKVADKYYLTWYSGGNAKSWYVRLLKVENNGTLTTGTPLLFSTTNSGIAFSDPLLLFTGTNSIYAPDRDGYYNISLNLSDLTCSFSYSLYYRFPSSVWTYDSYYYILPVDDNSKLMWVCTWGTNTHYVLSIKETSSGVLSISQISKQNITFNNDNMTPCIMTDMNDAIALVCNGTKINKFLKSAGYSKTTSGGTINGVAANTVKINSNNLKIFTS